MLCFAAWCGLHKQAKKGNTMVFTLLGGKFLGYINVDTEGWLETVQAKASKLLFNPRFLHYSYLQVSNAKRTCNLWDCSDFEGNFASSSGMYELYIAWDEAAIQEGLLELDEQMPNTTFDGSTVTAMIAPNEMIIVPAGIGLYSAATSFECFGTSSSISLVRLGVLHNLQRISIEGCQVYFGHESIPLTTTYLSIVKCGKGRYMTDLRAFTYLTRLTTFRFQGMLGRCIPDGINKLKNLTRLDLAYNKLGGDVRLGGLVNLEELFLQHNRLSGKLYVATCTKLRRLNVSHNKFKATVLDDIKLCKSLQEIDTSHNLF
jgi:hypothetical protein